MEENEVNLQVEELVLNRREMSFFEEDEVTMRLSKGTEEF